MSFHRANIVWQSKDGSWNRGFYTVSWVGYEEDGYDPEWDVEYDESSFSWASVGHATKDGACDAWDGANPGSLDVMTYSRANHKEIAILDRMALFYRDPAARLAHMKKEKAKQVKEKQAEVKEYMSDRTLEGMTFQRLGLTYDAQPDHENIVHAGKVAYGKADGTWLKVDGKRVYNFATGRVAKGILEVRVIPNGYNVRY